MKIDVLLDKNISTLLKITIYYSLIELLLA